MRNDVLCAITTGVVGLAGGGEGGIVGGKSRSESSQQKHKSRAHCWCTLKVNGPDFAPFSSYPGVNQIPIRESDKQIWRANDDSAACRRDDRSTERSFTYGRRVIPARTRGERDLSLPLSLSEEHRSRCSMISNLYLHRYLNWPFMRQSDGTDSWITAFPAVTLTIIH